MSSAVWTEAQLRDLHRVGDAFVNSHGLDKVSTAQSLCFVWWTLIWFAAPPVVYALLPLWIGLPVGVLLSLRAFNCLSQVTHMSVHGILLPSRWVADVLGDVCGYALGYTLYIRKQTHLEHHRLLNSPADPDVSWGAPTQSPADVGRGVIGDLLGLSILQKACQYYSVERRRFVWTFEVWGIVKFVVGMVSMQALVFWWYGLTGYLLLFLWPMATLYPALIRLRSFVEHSLDGPEVGWMSRTVTPSLLERFVMAPGCQFLHFEHHAYPGVPLYHLPSLHAYLVRCGAVVDEPVGYLGYVRRRLTAA